MSLSLPAVTWICGAAGAGKSAAAWALLQQRAAAGERLAYVDIDQLGMLYPGPGEDPEWHHAVKAEALATLLPGYAAAGVRRLVVSGVVSPHGGPRGHLPPTVELTLCLLSPDPGVLRERILARGWGDAAADEAVAEHRLLLAADVADVRIDTRALTVEQTAARLLGSVPLGDAADARVPDGPDRDGPDQDGGNGARTSPAGTRVVLITGPRVAGSSTVGFGFAATRWRAGLRTAFLDLQQLGFVARAGRIGCDAALAVGQLAAMHHVMTRRGAELVVVTGHLSVADRARVRAAFPRAEVTVLRLRADERTLIEHVLARVGGSDARLAGDDLVGADGPRCDAVVAAALAEQQVLDLAAPDDRVLDVSGRTPPETIADVARAVAAADEAHAAHDPSRDAGPAFPTTSP